MYWSWWTKICTGVDELKICTGVDELKYVLDLMN